MLTQCCEINAMQFSAIMVTLRYKSVTSAVRTTCDLNGEVKGQDCTYINIRAGFQVLVWMLTYYCVAVLRGNV